MTPSELADRYFTCIRAKDIDGLLALYEDDGVFVSPDGREFAGKAAIRAMQESVFSGAAPMPTVLGRIVGENAVAVEIEARLNDGTARNTANFYQLSESGHIRRLAVYIRMI